MSDTENKWNEALTHIIEELSEAQYKKMVNLLDEIPQGEKSITRQDMPNTIICHLGMDKSILAMERVMRKIPRNDSKVQDRLRPFFENLNKNKKGQQKKGSSDSESSEDETPRGRKRKYVSESESDSGEELAEAGPEKRQDRSYKGSSNSCVLSIADLKKFGLGGKAIKGKVIKKSPLINYDTKEKKKQVLFYMGLADDTASIKVCVYGNQKYATIQEGSSYLLEDLIEDKGMVKLIQRGKVSKTGSIKVPQRLEMEARMLTEPPQEPVCSIADAKASSDGSEMSIEGTIIDMSPKNKVKVKWQRTRKLTSQRILTLQDETGSIEVCLWGEQVLSCRASVGNTVRVTNVKSKEYNNIISLNSTGRTRVYTVQPATLKTAKLSIQGIQKCSKMKVNLTAEMDGKLKTFNVASKLLAQTCAIKLDGAFEETLLDMLPLNVEADIQGNKIESLKRI